LHARAFPVDCAAAGGRLPSAVVIALEVTLVVCVALLAVLVAGLLRRQAELGRAVEDLRAASAPIGPPPPPRRGLVGSPAPAVSGVDPAGAPSVGTWGPGRRTLVAFLTAGCGTCRPFWAGLSAGAMGPGVDVVVVTPSPSTESRRGVAALAGPGATVTMSSEAWTDYAVRGAPWFAVVVDGTVRAEGTAGSWEELRRLVSGGRL
jgi:hypothetical protein